MFAPNDDQQLLMDSARRFTDKHYAYDKLESVGEEPLNAPLWSEMVEAGWLMLPFAEADGGLQPEGSSGLADTASLFEVLGEGLVAEPVLANAVIAGGLIAASDHAGRGELIEGIIGGETLIGTALHEPRARHDLGWCETRAVKDGDGWTLSGHKSNAIGGGAAGSFLVLARVEGEPGDGLAGCAIFHVPADADGVTVSRYRLRDDHWAADVKLDGAKLSGEALLLGPGDAAAALAATIDRARLAMAAEAVGIMKRLCRATFAYTSERKQFGMPLAGFQVLQHKMVDMSVAHDQARSLLYEALTADAAGDAEALTAAIHAAYRAASEDGLEVAKTAVQLHGGMGMSEELPIGRCLRRILAIRLAFPLD